MKTTQNILVEDFYKTKLTANLLDSWDLEINVQSAPVNKKWFIIVDPESAANRERMFYHDVVGNIIYVKAENRINPKPHSDQDNVQINDTSLIFNHLSENQSTTFYIEKTWALDVIIWWGPVLKDRKTIAIPDTPLTVADGVTTYVYYKTTTGEIKSTTTESVAETDEWIITSEIVSASWSIIDVNYRNYKFATLSNIDVIALPPYNITNYEVLRDLDADAPTLEQLANILWTLLEVDLVDWFKGPAGTITIGTVTTWVAWSSVIITNIWTAEDAILDITIPRWDKWEKGDKWDQGEKWDIGDVTALDSTSLKYMLGWVGTIGKAYSLKDYKQAAVWTSNVFWSIAQPRVAQSFFAQPIDIATLKLRVKTVSSPSDDVFLEIQTDNAWVPSGTVVANWTSNVINFSALTWTFAEVSFIFPSVPALTTETLYHIVIKRSWATNAVNHYAIESAWSDVQIGTMSIDTGTWANTTDDLYFILPDGYKLMTLWGSNFVWILQETWVAWEIKKANTNYDKNQTWLTPEEFYGYDETTWDIILWGDFKALSETEIAYSIFSKKNSWIAWEQLKKGDPLSILRNEYDYGLSQPILWTTGADIAVWTHDLYTFTAEAAWGILNLTTNWVTRWSNTNAVTFYLTDMSNVVLQTSDTFNWNSAFGERTHTFTFSNVMTEWVQYKVRWSNTFSMDIYSISGNNIDFFHKSNYKGINTSSDIFKADAESISKSNFVSFAENDAEIWERIAYTASDVNHEQKDLIPWAEYFLWERFINIQTGTPIIQSAGNQAWLQSYVWRVTTSVERQWQEILAWTDNIVQSIKVDIVRVGTPPSNIQCKIYEADRVTLIWESTVKFWSGDVPTGSPSEFDFLFDNLWVTPSTKFFVEFSVDGTRDSSNYYRVTYDNSDSYPAWNHYYYTSAWIISAGFDTKFNITMASSDTSDISTIPWTNAVQVWKALSEKSISVYPWGRVINNDVAFVVWTTTSGSEDYTVTFSHDLGKVPEKFECFFSTSTRDSFGWFENWKYGSSSYEGGWRTDSIGTMYYSTADYFLLKIQNVTASSFDVFFDEVGSVAATTGRFSFKLT